MATKATGGMAVPAAMPGAADAGSAVEGVPVPTFEWMGLTAEWGTRVRPGEHGLRLGDLNVGIYGEVPEVWEDQTRRPRGALPRPGVPPLPYNLRSKYQMWADSAANLYEEAIQRRWIPATDVPWQTLKPLPEDVERAVCQVCTELSQYANTEIEIIAYWQDQMSYGYYEVKQFLATATFDCTRLIDALRKRALANGGGLGVECRGLVNRMILESRGGWTESAAYQYLMRGTFTMHVLTGLLTAAHNDAERFIFSKAIEDHARHMTYGYDHLKYAVAHHDGPGQRHADVADARRNHDGGRTRRDRVAAGARDHLRRRHRRRTHRRHGSVSASRRRVRAQLPRGVRLDRRATRRKPASAVEKIPRVLNMTTATTLTSAWLETAQRTVNADPAFRKRGSIDTRMAVKVDKSAYLVTFSGFTCHGVRAIDERDLRDADFTIEMTAAVWDRFLAGRREGHGRTLVELDTTDAHRQSREPAQKTRFPALPYLVAGVLRCRRKR